MIEVMYGRDGTKNFNEEKHGNSIDYTFSSTARLRCLAQCNFNHYAMQFIQVGLPYYNWHKDVHPQRIVAVFRITKFNI